MAWPMGEVNVEPLRVDLSSLRSFSSNRPPKTIILDMDGSVSPTRGVQEGSAYDGRFGCTCQHPLFCFNRFGDLGRCALRPGTAVGALPGSAARAIPRSRRGGRGSSKSQAAVRAAAGQFLA